MTRDEKIAEVCKKISALPQNEVNKILFILLLGLTEQADEAKIDIILDKLLATAN